MPSILLIIQRESVIAAEKFPEPSNLEGTLVVITFFVCVGVTIALTILGGWQIYLISRSETTIEFYTNKRDARVLRKEGKVKSIIFSHIDILYTHIVLYIDYSLCIIVGKENMQRGRKATHQT